MWGISRCGEIFAMDESPAHIASLFHIIEIGLLQQKTSYNNARHDRIEFVHKDLYRSMLEWQAKLRL